MNNNNILADELTNEEIKESLKSAGRTWEEFLAALVSVSSYAICNALYATRTAVSMMNKAIRNDEYCNRKGFKMELNAVVSAMNANTSFVYSSIPKEYERVMIVQRETQEYLNEHIQRMYYTAFNWLGLHHFPKQEVMARVFVAICLCNMTCDLIDERVANLTARGHRFKAALRFKPIQVSARLQMLANRIEECYPGADDCDINDCQPLHDGAKAISAVCFDIELMELHAAYAIEQCEGSKVLKEAAPESYNILHPDYHGTATAI